MDSGTTTGVETPTSATSRRLPEEKTLPEISDSISTRNEAAQKTFIRKYRHVAAIHSKARPSTLSHDTDASPSFVGFRNLMVIVLGMTIVVIGSLCRLKSTDTQIIVVGNLRLVIENMQKVIISAVENKIGILRSSCRIVWQFNLPDMSRFPTERCPNWVTYLRPGSLSSLHCLSPRVSRCKTSTYLASRVCL